ncbi:alpha/beta hydrolase [Nonomuraea sp. NN258]|uniref:alpha/beta fold hydrolase n=1 Tax=Nonomuraea antri TaxID=2730852 RepID=UPI001568EFDF|nr:alpha/beta hydrolase [Nonomuraea antri]NRQ31416.1 alpha/beta hydrolase [Nonomuraea antri]
MGFSRKALAAGLLAGVGVGVAAGIASRRPHPRERLGGHRARSLTVETDDGVRLAVDVDAPDRPRHAVVFAHGWVLNRHCWHYQREALAGQALLVTYDQRGHGHSTPGRYADCTIERLGADLRAVIDAAVPPELPVVLVGHSMGGMTVMGLAASEPGLFGSRVVGVALLSTSAGGLAGSTFGLPGPLGRAVPRLTPLVLERLRTRAAFVDGNTAIKTRANWPFTRFTAFGPRARRDHVRFVNGMVAATPTEVMVGFFHGMMAHDKLAALQALSRVETLVAVGTHDRLTSPAHARRIAAALPHARLVVIPGAGHMIGLERPEIVNAELTDLLARAVPV